MNNDANHVYVKKQLTNNSIFEILLGIKNSWFFLIDDLLKQHYNTESFTKENRLFYFGITFVIIGLVIFLYCFLTENEQQIQQNDKIIEKYYFYNGTMPDINVHKQSI